MPLINSKKDKVLELDLRNKIFNLVSKFAGCHLRDLERKSSISYTTLKYHLHYLVKYNLIIEKKDKGLDQYFPKDISFKDIEILSILRQKNIRRILLLLSINNNCSFKDLEDFTKLPSSTLSFYLKKLIDKNIISRSVSVKTAKYKLIYNKDEILKLIITYKESFLDTLIDKTLEMWDLN